jgi:hypothetical protein
MYHISIKKTRGQEEKINVYSILQHFTHLDAI